jgi:two-component system nitrogen regulation response regulator NtrX
MSNTNSSEVERLVLAAFAEGFRLGRGASIQANPSAAPVQPPVLVTERKTLRAFRDEAESAYLTAMLTNQEWNISRTASLLGIERTNLHKKMRSLGITRSRAVVPPSGTSDTARSG